MNKKTRLSLPGLTRFFRRPAAYLILALFLTGCFAPTVTPAGAAEPASQQPAEESGASGWNWPNIKVPSLGSLSVNLPGSLASFSFSMPDRQIISESLASGAIMAAREIASAAFDAARNDLEKHATWHYKVVDLDNTLSASQIEQKLTDLGKETWELVSLTPLAKQTRYYFKKRGISLLRVIAPMFTPDR